MKKSLLMLLALALLLPLSAPAEGLPELTVEVAAEGLERPWDIAQLPDGSLLFTQRGGTLSRLADGQVHRITDLPQVWARGEGGLMGLALDTAFAENRLIYLAHNAQDGHRREVRVVRYRLDEAWQLQEEQVIVSGLPANPSGRHSGAQLEMGPDGVLWIGTGDAADGTTPQDPQSLGGKILRVDREGSGVPGNLPAPFDPRIYSYGHRNTQGLALLPEPADGLWGYSVEHGSHRDDEFNPLLPGNFGWDPPPPYDESVPMTDLDKYPDAIPAVWSSGPRTSATSGLARIQGAHWGALDGAYVIGVQKDQHLRVLILKDGALHDEHSLFAGEYGRIRAVTMGQDGALYFGTDNGDDRILRVTPR